ncbi:MAG: desulfoferrodoxin Dfx [Candidatus Nomurabacteria bacterium]|jgi:superoxide reductase|nr:desulfoferrodoxin Dfx [Candidatus Nomurabacteria bacterium]
MKFYKCKHCGNMFAVVYDAGVTPQCCGEDMTEMQAASTDGALEKHVPVIVRDGYKVLVKVGSESHPMTPEHYIEWVAAQCAGKFQLIQLKPGDAPEAEFMVDSDEPITAYEYCNLHGLYTATEA